MPIKTLKPAQGYPLDSRPPRWDPIAVSYANQHFGSKIVSKILEKYKRSHISIEALRSDVMEYDVIHKSRPQDDEVYIAAYQSVREQFTSQLPIVPLTIGAAAKSSSSPKDKSPGLPWIHQGFKTKEEVWSDHTALTAIRTDWILIGKGYPRTHPDCLVYARAQLCAPDENKIRATWGYPTSVFTEEIRFVYPYLDFLKKRRDDYPLAYGVEMAKGGMGYIDEMYTRAGKGATVGMLDWSRFDKYVPPWLIRDAFNILKENFDFSHVLDSEGKIWEVNPEISNNRWHNMVNYFINTPFRMPNGDRYKKAGGVPSGSAWTNIIDSIINAIVVRYSAYHCMGSFPEYDIYMGDDSVIITQKILNLEDIGAVALDVFGFHLNLSKSYTTKRRCNIQFLGYYDYDGYPIREQDFLIASWMLPEHVNIPDPVFTAVRAVGQMYSTFNGQAAARWYAIIERIQMDYRLPDNWFTKYMGDYPNRLKYLRLHGIEATTLPQPKPFDVLCAPMAPPRQPILRRPCHRTTRCEDLYFRYQDSPIMQINEYITIEVTNDLTGNLF